MTEEAEADLQEVLEHQSVYNCYHHALSDT